MKFPPQDIHQIPSIARSSAALLLRRFAVCILALSCLLLPASALFSQDSAPPQENLSSSPDAFIGKRIEVVDFRGLINIREADIRTLRDNFLYKTLDSNLVGTMLVDAFNYDYFSLVELRYANYGSNGVRIVFQFTERPKVSRVLYEGRSSSVSKQDIDDVIQIRGGETFFDEGMLEPDERAIENLYRDKGFLNTRVSSSFSEDPKRPNRITVTFFINEGERLQVVGVDFVGSSFSKAKLFGARDPSGRPLEYRTTVFFLTKPYSQRNISDDIRNYENFYRNEGYLDMRVTRVDEVLQSVSRTKRQISGAQTAQNTKIRLVFNIEEGPRYNYNGVNISGNILYSKEELESIFSMKKGDPFKMNAFRAAMQLLQDKYVSLGYTQTQIIPVERKDTARRTVSYDIQILENKVRSRIESIDVAGNDFTKDYIILRDIPLKRGDVFNARELRRGLENLYYSRLFETVEPEILPGSAPDLVRIIIHVTEANTTNITAGLTLTPTVRASEFPVSGKFQFNESNFLGRAYNFGVQLQVGTTSQTAQVNFANSRLFGSNFGLGLSLTYAHSLNSNIAQDLDGNGILDPYLTLNAYQNSSTDQLSNFLQLFGMDTESHSFSLGINDGLQWRIPIFNRLSRLNIFNSYQFRFNFLTYDQDVFRPLDSRSRTNYNTWLFNDTFSLGATWSTTDLPNEANRGINVSQSFTLGGLLPTDNNINYLTSKTGLDVYIPLLELSSLESDYVFRIILYLHTGLDLLLAHPWSPQALNVQNYGSQLQRFTSGNKGSWSYDYGEALWTNSIQFRFPLVPQIFTFDIFFDALLLWRNTDQIANTTFDDFRFTVGFGPRLVIPQLPLAIYISKNFRSKNGKLDGNPEPGNVSMDNGWALSLVFNLPF